MIAAFGPAATSFASGLDANGSGTIDAIVTDPGSVLEAYLAAVARRERGENFYGMVLLDDVRIGATYRLAADIIAQSADPDVRDIQLGMLAQGTLEINGRPCAEFWPDQPELRAAAYEFFVLCDAVLVRSYTDYVWVASLFRDRPMPALERVVNVPSVPDARRSTPARPGIVVWAPKRPAAFVALHVDALADVHGEITVVCGGGTLPATLPDVAVLAPGDARVAAALARATCVVCAEPNDPGDAVAFARLGFGVVAPLASGAHEYVRNAQLWDGLSYYQLYTAVVTALGRPATALPLPPPPARIEPPACVQTGAALPLVSIVLPTYNRREFLARALEGVARQTYPNIELIVVNDAGEPVDDIVAQYAVAHFIANATNRGALRAFESGFAASTGAYVMFLPDDDAIYPDHVARIMDGLLHAGAKLAHSAMLVRYLETTPAGTQELRGLNAKTFARTMNLSDTLLASTVSVNQCIQHRSVFDDVGWWLNDSGVSDNEFHMRLLQRHTPVFVPNVTCEFRVHQRGNFGASNDHLAALADVYANHHPFPGRPMLAELRRRTLEGIAQREPGQWPFPPSVVIAPTPAASSPDSPH